MLDLSMNRFTGRIPDQVSALTDLEMLDLSQNKFSDEIPSSLKALTFLSWFSVAHNQLTGRIPRGGQLENFLSASYIDNPGLRGFPLPDNCSYESPTGSKNSVNNYVKDEDELEVQWFYVLSVLGYATGFFVVCFTLWLHTSWRNAYFNFLLGLKDSFSDQITISASRLRGN